MDKKRVDKSIKLCCRTQQIITGSLPDYHYNNHFNWRIFRFRTSALRMIVWRQSSTRETVSKSSRPVVQCSARTNCALALVSQLSDVGTGAVRVWPHKDLPTHRTISSNKLTSLWSFQTLELNNTVWTFIRAVCCWLLWLQDCTYAKWKRDPEQTIPGWHS